MLLFLKLNSPYLNQDQKKESKPYLWTLFNWRPDSYIIPPKSENSNEKENSLIIKSPTTSQINKKLINRFIIFVVKRLIHELALFISTKYMIDVPAEKAYQIRLVEFITKGTPFITMALMRQYLIFLVSVYLSLSSNYDFITIIVTIFFRFFHHPENNHESILIRSGFLTPSEYVSLNEWIITFIFNTKHWFSEPWMASSPHDFWSTRWQLSLN